VAERPVELPGSAMTKIHSATPFSPSIHRPFCPECNAPMWLARIDPEKPDHEQRMFECAVCNYTHTEVVKFK
jgi:RNase P subunit RPR2